MHGTIITYALKDLKHLFTAGVIRLQLSGRAAFDFFDNVSEDYGTEEAGIASTEDNVVIPQFHIELSENQQTLLKESIHPLFI